MNKRQAKKDFEKFGICEMWSASTYRECKEMKREYHEHFIYCSRNNKDDDELAGILGITFKKEKYNRFARLRWRSIRALD